MDSRISIIIDAVDNATATIKRAGASVDGFVEKNRAGMQAIGVASWVALAGIVALWAGAVNQASKMQDLRQQFDTLTWSAEKGKALFMDIQKFASQTPFDSSQLAGATSTMLGFWVAQEKVMWSMKMLGDIALWNGDRLQSLSLAFAQVTATGKLTGQDLLQMVNAWFNPLEAIAKKTGQTMTELKEKMSQGWISVAMVEDAMKSATSEGGRFFEGMQKASLTFSGVMSTLRDNIWITLASIAWFSDGEVVKWGLIDNLTKGMTAVMPYLEAFSQWASQNGQLITGILAVVGWVSALVVWLTTLGFVLPSLIAWISTLGAILGAIWAPILIVIGAIGALGLAWSTNFLWIRDITASVWEWIKTTFQAGIDWIMTTIEPFLVELRKFWDENWAQILEGLAIFWEGVKIVFTEIFEWIKLYVGTAWDIISGIFSVAFELIKGTFQIFFEALTGILTVWMQILQWDWSGAWETVKNTFATIGGTIVETWKAVFEKLHGVVTSIVERIETYVKGSLQRIKDTLKEIVTLGQANTQTYNSTPVAWARANGWPVFGGSTYLVGERGPELFTAPTNGNIVPNNQLWWNSVEINIDMGWVVVRNESDIKTIVDRISDELARKWQLFQLWIAT